jgi:hypothetical protein
MPQRVEQEVPLDLVSRAEQLDNEIEASRYILNLQEDWDENGSPGYSEETWNRAIQLLRAAVSEMRLLWDVRYNYIPSILPGPNGSIDLHWKTEHSELLINVPPIGKATFYGDDYGDSVVKGSFDPAAPRVALFAWLLK